MQAAHTLPTVITIPFCGCLSSQCNFPGQSLWPFLQAVHTHSIHHPEGQPMVATYDMRPTPSNVIARQAAHTCRKMWADHIFTFLTQGENHYLVRQQRLLQKQQLSFRHSRWTLPPQQSYHHHLQSQTCFTTIVDASFCIA